jgi:periplasmic copper chaperone A
LDRYTCAGGQQDRLQIQRGAAVPLARSAIPGKSRKSTGHSSLVAADATGGFGGRGVFVDHEFRQAGRPLAGPQQSIAGKVEIHESRNVEGAMQMRAVTYVECPPGTTVKIEPGGLHVMLIGLTRPLIAGTVFTLTLQFRDAGALTLRVPVEARA